MEREGDFGNFMDFYNRQKSPIYDGRGNVTGYNHGYGKREDFDKPIPRDEYTGPGPDMGESRRPRKDIVNRPTRDLNDDRAWTGGSRDFDERTGTNRPGFRDVGIPEYGYKKTEKEKRK